MKRIVVFIIFVSVIISGCKDEWTYNPVKSVVGDDTLEIARFYQNKNAAISLTFDDGTFDQYQNAIPQLESRGFRGTFYINGKKSSLPNSNEINIMNIDQIQDLEARGHEVGSHTWSHLKLTTMSLDSVRQEIYKNDSAISKWVGHKPYSIAFPHNERNKTIINIAKEGRIGVRTFETGMGQTHNNSTYQSMCDWMNDLIKTKKWGVAMYHGITRDYDMWNDVTVLWSFWDELKINENKIWIAPFYKVSAYTQEAENVHFDVVSTTDGKTRVRAACTLNSDLFNHPLTLIIKSPNGQSIKEIQPNEIIEL